MTDRQRFWLKVALAVTCPVWAVPVAVLTFVYMLGWLAWVAASEIVEPTQGGGKLPP